ncbi:hypothetical protein ACQJBY_043147 [Aegilops geniculata]
MSSGGEEAGAALPEERVERAVAAGWRVDGRRPGGVRRCHRPRRGRLLCHLTSPPHPLPVAAQLGHAAGTDREGMEEPDMDVEKAARPEFVHPCCGKFDD